MKSPLFRWASVAVAAALLPVLLLSVQFAAYTPAMAAPAEALSGTSAATATALRRTAQAELRQTRTAGATATALRRTAQAELRQTRTAGAATATALRRTAQAELRATQTATAATAVAGGLGTATVLRVVDGDTFIVNLNGVSTTTRLIGVDTPESVDPRQPVQCFGREAAARTRELIDGQTVTLEFDASQGRYDRYGRLLAHVRLADGTLLGQQLIRDGYAFEYTYRLPYRYQESYRAAQQQARSDLSGLWAPEACAGVVATPATPTSVPQRCPSAVDAAAASNTPLVISALDKVAERITLTNLSGTSVSLDGWLVCSLLGAQRHLGVSGSIAAGASRDFVHSGSAIWNNRERDPAALFAPDGSLVSSWPDR
jgi:micrococcal nuclease